jgi:hypothetical protein
MLPQSRSPSCTFGRWPSRNSSTCFGLSCWDWPFGPAGTPEPLSPFSVNLVQTYHDSVAAFYLPFGRFWELLTGAMLAICLSPACAPLRRAIQDWAAIIGLAMIAGAMVLCGRGAAFPGWIALVPIGGTILLIASPDGWVNRGILAHPAAVAVGLVSYPLYLWHWPLLSFTSIVGQTTPSTVQRLVAIAMSTLLAAATYALIEKQLRKRGGATAVALALSVAIVGVLGEAVHERILGNGNDEARDDVSLDFPPKSYTADPIAKELFSGDFRRQRDFYFVPTVGVGRVTAVIGDSHATRLYAGLLRRAGGRVADAKLMNIGRGTCLPLLDIEIFQFGRSMNCQPLMNAVINHIANSQTVNEVVISAFFSQYLDGRATPRRAAVPTSESPETFLEQALMATVERLHRGSKHIILAIDVPEVPFPVHECRSRPLRGGPRRKECAFERSLAPVELRWRTILQSVREKFTNVDLADPSLRLCPGGRCQIVKNGTLLYRNDGNHLTSVGATLVAPELERLSINLAPR